MEIALLDPAGLSDTELNLWRAWQLANPMLDSPFFSPRFFLVASQVLPGVKACLIANGAEPCGILPLMKVADIMMPPAAYVCDFSGLIRNTPIRIELDTVLHSLGLTEYRYFNQVEGQDEFRPYHQLRFKSPFLDLSKGYAHFRSSLARRTHLLNQLERKARKLGRELGPLKLVKNSRDSLVWEKLKDWKSAQYLKQNTHDCFSIPWIPALLKALQAEAIDECRSEMAALYAGERLVAVHLGLYNNSVGHYWFPAYDPGLAPYSPGLILLLKLAESLADLGYKRLDLGRGDERYKGQFTDLFHEVALGRAYAF